MTLAIGILIGAAIGTIIGGILANGAAITRDLDRVDRHDEPGVWN